MRHSLLPTTALLATIVLVLSAPLAADVTLVKNGEPAAALFVPGRLLENAAKTPEKSNIWKNHDDETQRRRLRESVKDFVAIVERISGAKLEIVAGAPKSDETRSQILIGELATEKFGSPQKSAPFGQGLRIAVKGNAVGLIGEGDLGTSYAIYTLLHRLGCRWYMPSLQGEVLPSLKTITLRDHDFSEAPHTIFRGIWYADNDYARRNRMGGMELSAGHALEGSVPKNLRKTNPEIKAIIKGKPHERLVKWTHPLVAKGISETIFQRLEKDPQKASFSLSPDDGMGWDESDDTKYDAGDFDPAAGAVSKTDRLLVLGNRVAETVTARHPHVKFGILAYVDYTRPPVRERVHPAIIPEIAPIAFSRGHPMNDPREPNNVVLRELVEGWAKIVPATAYYFYAYNLAETGTPNPMLAKWGHDVPYVIDKGKCRYWQPETITNFESCLHALYMSNRLAWDPSEKPADVYAELHQKFYGHAGKAMAAYWQSIDDMWTQSNEFSGCGFGHMRRFTPEKLSVSEKFLQQAERDSQADAEKFRVKMARQSFDELKLFMKLRHDLAEGRFDKLAEEGQKYMKVMDELGAKYAPQYAFGVMHWTRKRSITSRYFRFYHTTYEDASRIAANFQILTTPPLREWRYHADKQLKGEVTGWGKEQFDDSDWKTTDCAVETWSTLGLHNYMGSLWYRRKVTLPEIPSGKKASLWIGATDGRVKVFVNGRAIPYVNPKGESADSFSGYTKPVSFDITSAVKVGENQVAVFATREFLNEAGTGGLIAPVVIYREK